MAWFIQSRYEDDSDSFPNPALMAISQAGDDDLLARMQLFDQSYQPGLSILDGHSRHGRLLSRRSVAVCLCSEENKKEKGAGSLFPAPWWALQDLNL